MFKIKDIVSARQFDKTTLDLIFKTADKIKKGSYDKNLLKGKVLATLFYEPSTRTRLSFESAMLKLGGEVISTESASQFSSVSKGETLEDTIRIVAIYCDVIVLRHFMSGASEIASKLSKVPVINAGDGEGEHPTQALYDLYTILTRLKKENFTISMVGDLTYGRTIHSLSQLIIHYPKVKINFVSPQALKIPDWLRIELKKNKVSFSESEDFERNLKDSDIIYMTRIQKERFKSSAEYQKYFGKYILDKKVMKNLKRLAYIMHPLPRVNEISPEIDEDPRAIYFEQAENGLYVRMALLVLLFDRK